MDDMELVEYLRIIRKRFIIIIVIPLIAMLFSGVLSFFVIKPQYQADTTLLVNQKPTNQQYYTTEQITVAEQLIKTYSDIIKSRTVEQAVVDKLHLPFSVGALDSMIQVSSPDQSQVIRLSVVAKSQPLAARIANELATTFQAKAQSLMNIENVQIVDPALTLDHASPVKPNKKLNVAIAFILGLMVSLGIAFLLEYLDTRLHTEEDVRRHLGVPVLGVIAAYAVDE